MNTRKKYLSTTVLSLVVIGSAAVASAKVPPPPVNQFIGIPDSVFSNLTEALCRGCHEDPTITKEGYLPDRHHLKVGQKIQTPSDVPYSVNTVSGPGGTYECLSCHRLIYNQAKQDFEFELFRDCLLCHKQVEGQATVHHRTPAAKGKDCKACHGPIDNPGDGHFVPSYKSSLVTPQPGLGTGPDGRGGCAFCHRPGSDTSTGKQIQVLDNGTTHHSTGLALPPYVDYYGNLACHLCHPSSVNAVKIRACEQCHGINSLHNIQYDSDGNGQIIPGGEKSWYGHIGTQDDCWGCHGFKASSLYDTQVSSAINPFMTRISANSFVKGTSAMATVEGVALQNEFMGNMLNSTMKLTHSATGKEAYVSPAKISESEMTVGVPSYLAEGNYKVQLVKNNQTSNALSITIKPDMTIRIAKCQDFGGNWKSITIEGTGYGPYSNGMQAANAGVGITGDKGTCVVNSWSDNQIKGSCYGVCPEVITVDGMYGIASASIGTTVASGCTDCHASKTNLVSCSSRIWALHKHRGTVDSATAAAIESSLGLKCAPPNGSGKDRSKKPSK